MSEDLRTTLYSPNEIVKTEDFNFGEDQSAENVHAAFRHLLGGVSNNVLIHGYEVGQRSTPSMNVNVAIGAIYNPVEGRIVMNGEQKGPIAIEASDGSQNRIDTVEVSYTSVDYNTEQRAFKDPVSGALSYSDVSTRKRYDVSINIVFGTLGSGSAPATTSGAIKIAEIQVSAGASEIYDGDIRNITATIDGGSNTNWTNEMASTFKIGDLSYTKSILRTSHNEDGSHKADSIKVDDIDFGSGAGQVKAQSVPVDSTQLHYSSATEIMGALDDIDQELYDHVGNNITSAVTVHGITQGTGNGLNADMVDGEHASAFASTSHTHSEGDLNNGAVDQSSLKTSSGSVSTSGNSNLTLPGGQYGFYPQIKTSGTIHGDEPRIRIADYITNTSYQTSISIYSNDSTGYAMQRYITSSGEIYWIFIMRRSEDGKILSMYQAPDHPSFGNGTPDEIIETPFFNYDLERGQIYNSETDTYTDVEIEVINPLQAQRDELKSRAKQTRKDILEVIEEEYDVQDIKTPLWPDKDGKAGYYDEPITVGLVDDEFPFGGEAQVIKKVIPKPSYVNVRKLVKQTMVGE